MYGEDVWTPNANFIPAISILLSLLPGRPLEADADKKKSLVESNRRLITRKIAKGLNLSNAPANV